MGQKFKEAVEPSNCRSRLKKHKSNNLFLLLLFFCETIQNNCKISHIERMIQVFAKRRWPMVNDACSWPDIWMQKMYPVCLRSFMSSFRVPQRKLTILDEKVYPVSNLYYLLITSSKFHYNSTIYSLDPSWLLRSQPTHNHTFIPDHTYTHECRRMTREKRKRIQLTDRSRPSQCLTHGKRSIQTIVLR